MSTEIERIHWSDLPFNKYLKKIEPLMLRKDGTAIKQLIGSVGKIKRFTKRWIEVIYDKDYIATKIAIELSQILNVISVEYFVSLMIDVWMVAHPMTLKDKKELLHEFMLALLNQMEQNRIDKENAESKQVQC